MKEMVELKTWFDYNKLSLNLSKIKYNTDRVHISIDGVVFERVSEIKFLAITVYDQMNWKSHLKHLQTKVSRSISLINKANVFLDNNSLRILYWFYHM